MMPISENARIFLLGTPVDLRNGFDGLSFLAQSTFGNELIPDSYFVFFNPRRTRMKVLYCSNNQLAIWYLRLRKGVFFPPGFLISVEISVKEFTMIMNKQPPKYLLCLKKYP